MLYLFLTAVDFVLVKYYATFDILSNEPFSLMRIINEVSIYLPKHLHTLIHLSVCLLATSNLKKTTDQIFMFLSIKKNRLNFGRHPRLDADLGILLKILQHCQIGYFSQFG